MEVCGVMNETNANTPKKNNRGNRKNATNQKPQTKVETNAYAYDTALPFYYSIFGDIIDSIPYSIADIQRFASNPQFYNKELRDLGWWAYNNDGSVRAAVNYMVSMHTLDRVVVCKNRKPDGTKPRNFGKNRRKMLNVLDRINYKKLIRDDLLKDANDGIAFYYFEVEERPLSKIRILSDYDVLNLTEINETVEFNENGLNISIIPLPVDWCRIVGMTNGVFKAAFNMRYFDQFNEQEVDYRIRTMPKEIRDFYNENKNSNGTHNWCVLDDRKTIITKVNASLNKPWGCPMAITALDDILYSDYFTKTKRNVLDNLNNQIIYMTFPEGKEKGSSSLTKDQQREQHEKVKAAITTRKNSTGSIISFFSLASGTKLSKIDVDLGIFDEKNENAIKDNVPASLGISSASLDGNTKGNYATTTINLELVAGNVYTWIEQFIAELNKCINYNVIQDSSCVVDCYILPTTFVNRDKQVGYMKDLYSLGKGSFIAWVSSTGFDADAYISLMDYELSEDFENKYPVHRTSYTQSSNDRGGTGTKETVDIVSATNENTIQSQSSGSNESPSPSD